MHRHIKTRGKTSDLENDFFTSEKSHLNIIAYQSTAIAKIIVSVAKTDCTGVITDSLTNQVLPTKKTVRQMAVPRGKIAFVFRQRLFSMLQEDLLSKNWATTAKKTIPRTIWGRGRDSHQSKIYMLAKYIRKTAILAMIKQTPPLK